MIAFQLEDRKEQKGTELDRKGEDKNDEERAFQCKH